MFLRQDHEPQSDNARTIYLVREGRAAVASYFHYMQNISGRRAVLRDLTVGKRWHGSWSSHVSAWAPSGRPNTFVLRHKELVAVNMHYLMGISDFIGLPEPKSASVALAQLQEQFPKCFRGGSNEKYVAELRGDDRRLYRTLHGETMERMGYADRIANTA